MMIHRNNITHEPQYPVDELHNVIISTQVNHSGEESEGTIKRQFGVSKGHHDSHVRRFCKNTARGCLGFPDTKKKI